MEDRVLWVCQRLGLFWLANFWRRRKILILCYHGISVRDEHRWWPGVFMQDATFRRRMGLLATHGYKVLSLQEALGALDTGEVPGKSVVITADDGCSNSPQTLVDGCSQYGFPITIYVTSYYAQKQRPIFNVMAHYMR